MLLQVSFMAAVTALNCLFSWCEQSFTYESWQNTIGVELVFKAVKISISSISFIHFHTVYTVTDTSLGYKTSKFTGFFAGIFLKGLKLV